jgi:adenylate kinase
MRPSLVCLFEQPEEESVRRLSNRRVDPQTGNSYNLEIQPPKDETTAKRLIDLAEDKEKTVRVRF